MEGLHICAGVHQLINGLRLTAPPPQPTGHSTHCASPPLPAPSNPLANQRTKGRAPLPLLTQHTNGVPLLAVKPGGVCAC